MSITINPPEGPWTVADLATLPDVGFRFEIRDGNLVMMSPVAIWHSRVMHSLVHILREAGQAAEMEVGVKHGHRNMRVADIAVFREPPTDVNQAYWPPDVLTLVVEIVSDSSADDDRSAKPRWYAHVGIPEYWRVEQGDAGEAVIFRYKLARALSGAAGYVEDGVTTLSKLGSEA